jgi:type II secretory pathway pseudopilin PulG
MNNDKASHLARWIGPIVTVGVVVLIIVLLLPALQQAREAARRTQSKNNLKQIGLALHNYHDTFNQFPPGGVFNAEGTGFHGWTTMIAPYLDASPFYNGVNFNIPWDDPLQLEYFLKARYPVFLNPSQEPARSPDGFSLVHYSANEWLFHRNSSVGIKDIETGTSNTFMVGNAFGDFTPFGYPYNWRDPLTPINTSSEGFGYNLYGMQVLLADGSVKWVEKNMLTEIHSSFAGPETLRPTAEKVEKPKEPYHITNRKMWTTIGLYSNSAVGWTLIGRKNPDGQLISARFESREKAPQRVKLPLDDALSSLNGSESLESFDGDHLTSDAGLKVLANFPNLQFLEVGGDWITDDGLESISQMANLRELKISGSQVTDQGVRYLLKLARLRTLELSTKYLGDEGIATIASLVTLERLEVRQADLREGRLNTIANLPQLQSLILSDVEITDEELSTLRPPPTLRTLEFHWFLKEPQLTTGAVSFLQETIPQTKVSTRDWSHYRIMASGRAKHAPSDELPADATQPINVPRQPTNTAN